MLVWPRVPRRYASNLQTWSWISGLLCPSDVRLRFLRDRNPGTPSLTYGTLPWAFGITFSGHYPAMHCQSATRSPQPQPTAREPPLAASGLTNTTDTARRVTLFFYCPCRGRKSNLGIQSRAQPTGAMLMLGTAVSSQLTWRPSPLFEYSNLHSKPSLPLLYTCQHMSKRSAVEPPKGLTCR